jgi:hypothetical protein
MKAEEHPAYDDGLRNAARMAGADPAGKSYTVYWDGFAIFVRPPGAEAPANARVVCIAQKWDSRTVQLRFDGARSEWVHP